MTGREMILYIQRHHLENQELFDLKGVPKGMLGSMELERKLGVASGTVRVWVARGKLEPAVRIAGRNYFYPETTLPDVKKRGRPTSEKLLR